MNKLLSCVAAGFLALAASSASAAVHTVHLEGQIISQMNPGTDPNIAVGDRLVLTGTFDDRAAPLWDGTGLNVAFLWNPTFQATLNGLTWNWHDEKFDGLIRYSWDYFVFDAQGNVIADHSDYANPAVVYQNGTPFAAIGQLLSSGSSATPLLNLGTPEVDGFEAFGNAGPGEPIIRISQFSALAPSSNFTITAPGGLYNNFYQTPGFVGVWDTSRSFVTNVPEPATWAMMLLGFAALGGLVRASRRAAVTA